MKTTATRMKQGRGPILLALCLLTAAWPAAASDVILSGYCSWEVSSGRINIEAGRVSNNDPAGFLSGTLRLQIWATDYPYSGGTIRGYVLGTRRLEQLEGGSYYYNLSGAVPFSEPPLGEYYTTMTLEEYDHGTFYIRDYLTFDSPTSFGGADLNLDGYLSWQIAGTRLILSAERISNDSSYGQSGSLRVSLWATDWPYRGGSLEGYLLGTRPLRPLPAGYYYDQISAGVRYAPPPLGSYYTTMTLEEYGENGYSIVDYYTFDSAATLGQGVGGSPGGDGMDLDLFGKCSYAISTRGAVLSVQRLWNRRWSGVSGSLLLQLWASDLPYAGGTLYGYELARQDVSPLAAGFYYQNVRAKVPSLPLPHGRFFITLTLAEFRNGHYVLVDSVSFPKPKSFK